MLSDIQKGKAKELNLPFIEGTGNIRDLYTAYNNRPQEIIVFFVGGCTYSEAKDVNAFNEENAGTRVIIGGTSIINSAMFLDQIYGC